ncbi:transcriptional regulator, partial [Tetzosporium hominis]
TLCNYENGKNIPSLENIRNLSIALEIDELEFVKEILDLL